MTLTLYLLRHAKSSWDHPGMSDFDRPLSERGHADAYATADLMAREGYRPRRVLCSTALRTRETLGPLLSAFPDEMEVSFSRRLYNAEAGDLLELLQALGDGSSPVLMVGHNPGIQDLANLLVTEGNADARLRLAAKYPTSGLAVMTMPIDDWGGVGTVSGALVDFHTLHSRADD
jgi:phosphohistidine phosphatase